MTLSSENDVDPRVAEKSQNEDYDDDDNDDDDEEKHYIVERPHKIKQSAHQSSSPCGKQEMSRERGELKRNAQIQAVRDCQGHRMSSSSRIITSSGPGRPPISSECKGYRDNAQQQTDLNRNQTKSNPFALQNVSKLGCKV